MSFDVASHHRRRTRLAEGRANGLERELAKALRLLGLALRVAAGDDCDPIVLLRALEQVDEHAQSPDASSIDDLAALLRETDPAGFTAHAVDDSTAPKGAEFTNVCAAIDRVTA